MINRSTLRSQIASALRDEILAGRLSTGRQFTVKEIAEQFGVSATPVREALIDLAAQGLLDIEHHRGFRVHEFTLDDYRSMVRARTLVLDGIFLDTMLIEEFAPERAVQAAVRRRAEAAERSARSGDLDVLIGHDLRFWKELSSLIGNPYVCDFLDRLRVQCWAYATPFLRRAPTLSGRLWVGHRQLVSAVEQADAEGARGLIAEYNRHAQHMLESVHPGAEA